MTHLGKFHLFMLCTDTKLNPGSRPNSNQSFSICYWNLNIIAALSFSKIFVLKPTMQYMAMTYVYLKVILTMTY